MMNWMKATCLAVGAGMAFASAANAEKAAPAGKSGGKEGKDGEKDEAQAKPFEPASKDDYQLTQAMNLLKALQVIKK